MRSIPWNGTDICTKKQVDLTGKLERKFVLPTHCHWVLVEKFHVLRRFCETFPSRRKSKETIGKGSNTNGEKNGKGKDEFGRFLVQKEREMLCAVAWNQKSVYLSQNERKVLKNPSKVLDIFAACRLNGGQKPLWWLQKELFGEKFTS